MKARLLVNRLFCFFIGIFFVNFPCLVHIDGLSTASNELTWALAHAYEAHLYIFPATS